MKQIGRGLLALGFLSGAFFAVQDSDEVHWEAFVPCAAVMLVAMGMIHLSGRGGEGEDAKVSASMDILHRSLDIALQRLGDLVDRLGAANPEPMNVYDVHGFIDGEIAEPLNAFAEAREAMIPRLGMSGYAEVMSSFATGERLINRSWCASADGYIDEVRACLDDAVREMQRAQVQLRELTPG